MNVNPSLRQMSLWSLENGVAIPETTDEGSGARALSFVAKVPCT
jgi:hypothetical protein